MIAVTAGVKIPVPATKEAAIRVDPPVTTSIALTEIISNEPLFWDFEICHLLCNCLCN